MQCELDKLKAALKSVAEAAKQGLARNGHFAHAERFREILAECQKVGVK